MGTIGRVRWTLVGALSVASGMCVGCVGDHAASRKVDEASQRPAVSTAPAETPGASAETVTAAVPKCLGKAVTITARPGEVVVGTTGADVIWGTSGPDVIYARDGRDRVCGNGGRDHIFG